MDHAEATGDRPPPDPGLPMTRAFWWWTMPWGQRRDARNGVAPAAGEQPSRHTVSVRCGDGYPCASPSAEPDYVLLTGASFADFRGRSMPQVEPVLIFDLDRTNYLKRNSFPIWAMMMLGLRGHGLAVAPPRGVALSLAVQRVLLARKLHRLDHDSLMRQLQTLWRVAAAEEPGATLSEDLQARLAPLVRPALLPILRLVAEDVMDGVMATAAAGDYAIPLGRTLGFSTIIATGIKTSAGRASQFRRARTRPCARAAARPRAGRNGHASSSAIIWTTCR